ncbi:MAG: hypothetical protein R3E48_10825 [Burkholderiaceae bacterium]
MRTLHRVLSLIMCLLLPLQVMAGGMMTTRMAASAHTVVANSAVGASTVHAEHSAHAGHAAHVAATDSATTSAPSPVHAPACCTDEKSHGGSCSTCGACTGGAILARMAPWIAPVLGATAFATPIAAEIAWPVEAPERPPRA